MYHIWGCDKRKLVHCDDNRCIQTSMKMCCVTPFVITMATSSFVIQFDSRERSAMVAVATESSV